MALPVLLFAEDREDKQQSSSSSLLQLYGGTDADFAPPVGYLQRVLLPTLRRLWGLEIEDQVSSRYFNNLMSMKDLCLCMH